MAGERDAKKAEVERHREVLDEAMARAHERDQRLAAEFRERLAAAPEGWLPPAEKRHEVNDEAFEKCLGIGTAQFRALTPGQRLELVSLWFAGNEVQIPYEDWGLDRPSWLPR